MLIVIRCAILILINLKYIRINDYATRISNHLLPRTNAYHEIWLDGEKVLDSSEEKEPIYGNTYLPRKFKIGIAVPPSNDIDVYSQDIGFNRYR